MSRDDVACVMNREVWCFIEPERQNDIATECARLGSQIRCQPCGILVGGSDNCLEQELGRYGIEKLYVVEPTISRVFLPEDYTYLLTSLINKSPPYVCIFAASPLGNEVAARVATRSGAALITWCVDLNFVLGKLVATKKAYDGKVCKRMIWQGPPPYLATVDPAVLEAIPADEACLPVVEKRTLPLQRSEIRSIEHTQLGWRDMPLTEAVVVLGVGAGVTDNAGMKLIEHLAQLLDTPIGGTKRADEMGLVPRESRIGASGIYIEPDVYIAIGISGASHHMVGIRKAKHVVAINQDKIAPIFEIAELGIVDDFRSVVTSIIKQLSQGN